MRRKIFFITLLFFLCSATLFSIDKPLLTSQEDSSRFSNDINSYEARLKQLKKVSQKNYDWEAGEMNYNRFTESVKKYGFYKTNRNRFAIMFYHIEEDHMNIWLLDTSGIRNFVRVPLDISFLMQNDSSLKSSIAFGNYRDLDKLALSNLSDLLFPTEIRQQLFGVRDLIIIPEKNIGAIPFYLLMPFGNVSYLIDSMTVSISPSIFAFEEYFLWNYYVNAKPLIIGISNCYHEGFRELPGAFEEAKDIADLYGTTVIDGLIPTSPYSMKYLVQDEMRDADLIYFATHGYANSDYPLSSYILLCGGELTAGEIQNSNLNAYLVVLSACQTGLGQYHDAGTIGLARSFYLAGSRNVVMSLWDIRDKATARLMTNFIKEYKISDLPARSLRKAMLIEKKVDSAPLIWASFNIFGLPN